MQSFAINKSFYVNVQSHDSSCNQIQLYSLYEVNYEIKEETYFYG